MARACTIAAQGQSPSRYRHVTVPVPIGEMERVFIEHDILGMDMDSVKCPVSIACVLPTMMCWDCCQRQRIRVMAG